MTETPNTQPAAASPSRQILTLYCHTPLHVGAGSSVGAIDQPVIRERHTGFPTIPNSTLKGVCADWWVDFTTPGNPKRDADGAWLLGSEDANAAKAGALHFGEASLVAFPLRSAAGCYAWITCPLLLRRLEHAAGLTLPANAFTTLQDTEDELGALYDNADSPINLNGKVVLEEYTLTRKGGLPAGVATFFAALHDAALWSTGIAKRLVIVTDGTMSFFTRTATEVAQHVKIDPAKGTATKGALFNQENVPSESVFFTRLHGFPVNGKSGDDALKAFANKLSAQNNLLQVGGDASTGLGYCSANLKSLPIIQPETKE